MNFSKSAHIQIFIMQVVFCIHTHYYQDVYYGIGNSSYPSQNMTLYQIKLNIVKNYLAYM